MNKWEPKTPFLATDGIVKLYDKNEHFQGLIFIERLNKPFGIALPGGFVNRGEKIENALKREMLEEISLEVKIEKLLGVYSNPQRDKRFHCVSCVFICKAVGKPIAADDAKKVFVYKKDQIPFEELVFDHKEIIKDFLILNEI